MIFNRTVKHADREVREQLRLFKAKKVESEKFMAKINAAIAEMSAELEKDAKVKEQLLRQLNDIEVKSQSTTTEESTATAAAPCTSAPVEEQQNEQNAATEREVERDPHHIVLSSPIPTAEDIKKQAPK